MPDWLARPAGLSPRCGGGAEGLHLPGKAPLLRGVGWGGGVRGTLGVSRSRKRSEALFDYVSAHASCPVSCPPG